jgi:molybdopterin-guanine dinucleotide biosynthesis protein A
LKREKAGAFSKALEGGERRLEVLLHDTAKADGDASWMYDDIQLCARVEDGGPDQWTLKRWFLNVNTPEELVKAEAWGRAGEV